MLSSKSSYMLALAAIPCLLHTAQAAHIPLEVRDEAAVLFAAGGPQLGDIVIIDPGKDRDEKASIVAQCLIATRKLSPAWISAYFKDYDGQTETKTVNTVVKPYWHWSEPPDTKEELEVDSVKAKEDATSEGLAFGSSETAPWWPYAMLSGIRQAGWDKPDNQQNGVDLAKDALNLITGYMAKNPNVPTDMKDLEKSDFTPILLNIEKFDEGKSARTELKLDAPKNLRWEAWVTVMSYDDTTKVLQYATSFVGSEGEGISQRIHIDDVTIKSMVTLSRDDTFAGRVADVRGSTMTYTAPQSTPAV